MTDLVLYLKYLNSEIKLTHKDLDHESHLYENQDLCDSDNIYFLFNHGRCMHQGDLARQGNCGSEGEHEIGIVISKRKGTTAKHS